MFPHSNQCHSHSLEIFDTCTKKYLKQTILYLLHGIIDYRHKHLFSCSKYVFAFLDNVIYLTV